MPYLDKSKRPKMLVPEIHTPGELNYLGSQLIEKYTEVKGLNYQTINDVIGALECLKQEVYRRIAAPYETVKCEENGEVFGKWINTL